jgi:hypothetical protein
MNRKTAAVLLLAACVVIAALLLAGYITTPISGILFAASLVTLGVLSQGFRKP